MELPNASRRKFLTLSVCATGMGLVSTQILARTVSLSLANTKDIATYASGRKDATDAIQALIDRCSVSGAVVNIPKGVYLIDAGKGIRLRNGTRLKMDPDAMLIALPETSGNYAVIKVYGIHDARIEGGEIVGERDHHLGKGGEWGFGIDIKGSTSIYISNISVSNCWGDGFYVGGESSDITLDGVTASKNRRQGLSITSCDRILVVNSKFTLTSGTAPSAGIDVEPNKGEKVSNVSIENCEINDNAGCGILTWNDTTNLKIVGCTIENNGLDGIYLKGTVSTVDVSGNHVADNKKKDINVGPQAATVKINGKVY